MARGWNHRCNLQERPGAPPSPLCRRLCRARSTGVQGDTGGTHLRVCTGRAPDHLWGLFYESKAEQAFLTYCQGQSRLLYLSNDLNLSQGSDSSSVQHSGTEAKGTARGKPARRALLSPGPEVYFIWHPPSWASACCLVASVPVPEGGRTWGRTGPHCSP